MWNISDDSKIIFGYNVIRATSKVEVQVEDFKTKELKVEAWFTPEINLPFGPSGFGDLPGLILELKYYNNHYLVKEIKKVENSQIVKPKFDEIITLDDYLEFIKNEFNKTAKF